MDRLLVNFFKSLSVKQQVHRITLIHSDQNKKNQVARYFPASKLPDNYIENLLAGTFYA